jgi:hypothetical protein
MIEIMRRSTMDIKKRTEEVTKPKGENKMENARVNQILENLKGFGTNPSQLYTNQEIVDHLTALQTALARGVFERLHAENLRERDIMIHFESLAVEYGLEASDLFIRFKSNMSELGYTIGSFIKGMHGERIARRALKLLSYEKDIRILYNVQLADDEAQAEYDAIVIAPYGLFVVEVKNWGASMTITPNGLLQRDDDSGIVYDLPGRMSLKEALLREYLGDLFPNNYHNMLLLSNEKAQLQDNYRKISVSCGGGIAYEIKSYNNTSPEMSDAQVNIVAESILKHHKEQRALCPIKCEEIITDYSVLMAQIEEASSVANEESILYEATIPKSKPKESNRMIKWFDRINWKKVGTAARQASQLF